MTTEDFISELFYRVDEGMKGRPKPPEESGPADVGSISDTTGLYLGHF